MYSYCEDFIFKNTGVDTEELNFGIYHYQMYKDPSFLRMCKEVDDYLKKQISKAH